MRIIHISDPHLSSLQNVSFRKLRGKRLLGYQSWYRKRRHQYQTNTLQQITRAVSLESADLVIVTGDLVHIGLESELHEAREWLEGLGSPDKVLVVPGNHDCYHPESWPLVQRLYQPYLGADPDPSPNGAYPVLKHVDGISIIAASSAAPSPWWAASGTLGAGQRQRLRHMLLRENGYLRILALHHPPLPDMTTARKALTDAAELREIFESNAPQITLHGHLHRNQTVNAPHGPIYCTAPASSVQTSRPASYRVIQATARHDEWHIDMTLKSLVGGQIKVTESSHWCTPRRGDSSTQGSFDPGQGKNTGPQ
jgi:3',5'-cyclic AMP phosphodiesterase CpdA